MPRFAANISLLFGELPFLDRIGAAADAGFEAVECQFPYDWPVDAIAQRLQRHRLPMVLHNLPAGRWAEGERGIACHPGRVDEFREGVEQALGRAVTLKVPQLNCLAGLVPPGVSRDEAEAVLVDNLRYAASELARHGMRLLVEPLNARDVPGFLLTGSVQTLALIERVGRDNVFLQYDVYHMQRTEGELAATLQRHLPLIGHVQIADTPGRHEPGSGEINYRFLFRHLDAIGYDGWVGCEYVPRTGTVAGLTWRAVHGV